MQTKTSESCSVTVPAELTADSTRGFEIQLKSLLPSTSPVLILDCSQLTHTTSSHINLLWQAYQSCNEIGKSIKLSAATPGLIRVLSILDLDELFGCTDHPWKPDDLLGPKLDSGDTLELYTQHFRPDTESIDRAIEKFLHFLAGLNISDMLRFELKTIFYEVTTNIRTYSGLKKDDLIVFTARPNHNGIVLTFADRGLPFNPTTQITDFDASKAAKKRQSRGFGIVMVRKMADRITYVRQAGSTNMLTLEKKWS